GAVCLARAGGAGRWRARACVGNAENSSRYRAITAARSPSVEVLHLRMIRHDDARMAAAFVDRNARRGQIAIGEVAEGDRADVGQTAQGPIHGRSARGAEAEGDAVAFVANALEFGHGALATHFRPVEARLRAERSAGAFLAFQAMAHRDAHRLTRAGDAQSTAAAAGDARGLVGHRYTLDRMRG